MDIDKPKLARQKVIYLDRYQKLCLNHESRRHVTEDNVWRKRNEDLNVQGGKMGNKNVSGEYKNVGKLNHEHAELNHEHAELNHEHAELNHEHPDLNHEHPELNHEHPELNQEHPKLNQTLDERERVGNTNCHDTEGKQSVVKETVQINDDRIRGEYVKIKDLDKGVNHLKVDERNTCKTENELECNVYSEEPKSETVTVVESLLSDTIFCQSTVPVFTFDECFRHDDMTSDAAMDEQTKHVKQATPSEDSIGRMDVSKFWAAPRNRLLSESVMPHSNKRIDPFSDNESVISTEVNRNDYFNKLKDFEREIKQTSKLSTSADAESNIKRRLSEQPTNHYHCPGKKQQRSELQRSATSAEISDTNAKSDTFNYAVDNVIDGEGSDTEGFESFGSKMLNDESSSLECIIHDFLNYFQAKRLSLSEACMESKETSTTDLTMSLERNSTWIIGQGRSYFRVFCYMFRLFLLQVCHDYIYYNT